MPKIERHDPFGGAFGLALAVAAGDVMVATVSGVTGLDEGVPVFAETFDDQVRAAGRLAAAELAEFGFTTADIIDALVVIDPGVVVDPGMLLDSLQQHVFAGAAPVLLFTRSVSITPSR
jgi:hypothetical protein